MGVYKTQGGASNGELQGNGIVDGEEGKKPCGEPCKLIRIKGSKRWPIEKGIEMCGEGC